MILGFGLKVLYKEWRLTNSYGSTRSTNVSNLFSYASRSFIEKIYRLNIVDPGIGLDIVSLNIPEKSINFLTSDLPNNIKKWQPAFMRYSDGGMYRIKIKMRGDNPLNWSHEKKSFRVKTKKKKLVSMHRVFDYSIIQNHNLLDTYMSYYIARLIELPVPESRLVELVINGKSQGIYIEHAKINEGFLRRNNIMPVNLYKGEQYHTERSIDRSTDLFNNPYLWKKIINI